MRLVFAISAALLLSMSSAAQEPSELPFRLIDGWAIVTQGTLGGIANRTMLIDTGAVPSAINARLAARLHLIGVSEESSVMNRRINVSRVCVPEVRLGPVGGSALDMVAMDLGGIERTLGTRIDAVIGLDLLGRQNFTIDYARRKLEFHASRFPMGAIAFEMKHEAGGAYIVVPMESGGERFEMLLDTGTKDLMLFAGRLRSGLQRLRVRGQDLNLNAGGRDRLEKVEMELVRVGPVLRRKQPAYMWSIPNDERPRFDGLLGPAAFGATVIGFDFERHVISLEVR